MEVGILGGSFNPVHFGHLLVCQQLLEKKIFDRIVLLPAYSHTFDKPLASFEHRLEMLKRVLVDNIEISTIEADYRLDGNTINAVPYLKKNFPDDQVSFIIGTDQLPTFTQWGSWEDLLVQLPFLVIPRANFPARPLYSGMSLLPDEDFIITNISSSVVRKKILAGQSIEYLVPKAVIHYISQHDLYTKNL